MIKKKFKITQDQYKGLCAMVNKPGQKHNSKDYYEQHLIIDIMHHKEFGIKRFMVIGFSPKYWDTKKRKFLEFTRSKPVYAYSTTYGYEYHSNVDWTHPEYGKFGKFNDEIVFNFKFDSFGYRSMVSFVKL